MSFNKRVLSIIRYFQNKIENKIFPLIDEDQNILQQSKFLIRAITWVLIATSGFGVVLLIFSKTDEIVIVEGKLEPIGDVKEVQIPSSGVIKKILVQSGDRVNKGQALILFDKESSEQDVKSLQNQIIHKNNHFELKKLERIKTYELNEEVIDTLKKIYLVELNILNRLNSLLQEGAISEFRYLQQSKKTNTILGQISEKEKEGERQLLKLDQELETINSEISRLMAKDIKAKVLLRNKSIRSPVDGLIFDLKPTSEGFRVQSSEPILKIVPFENLEADVLIPSNKIGFVYIGMPVEISIDSFPATDFGPLMGEVISIGSDAVKLPIKQPEEFYFPTTIALNSQKLILKDGTELRLQVGMSLQANLKLRRVNYLQLLLGRFNKKTESLKKL